MAASGLGNFYFLNPGNTTRAANYLNVLTDRFNNMINVRNTTIFMQDGAPCHNAKVVKEWLVCKGIAFPCPWTGNSPDLNPIENLWSNLKAKVSAYKPSSLGDLKSVIQLVLCKEITIQVCIQLVESMSKRLIMVIKNSGKTY